jgi:hypothetical protein
MTTTTSAVVPSNPGPTQLLLPNGSRHVICLPPLRELSANAVQKNSWQMKNNRMNENIGA